jgi:hypothetical protein
MSDDYSRNSSMYCYSVRPSCRHARHVSQKEKERDMCS